MRKQIIVVLLCGPAAANAEKLLVEYQGTVSSVDRADLAEIPPYAVGDSISGSLVIDLSLAPPDEVSDTQLGRYYGGSPGIDFILGSPNPGARGSGDLVLVYDDWVAEADTAPLDGFFIRDRSIGDDGNFDLVLGLQRPNLLGQLFSNDGLAQSFAVEREEGTNLWGYIDRGFGEFFRSVSFTLDRFTVRPGTCRA